MCKFSIFLINPQIIPTVFFRIKNIYCDANKHRRTA